MVLVRVNLSYYDPLFEYILRLKDRRVDKLNHENQGLYNQLEDVHGVMMIPITIGEVNEFFLLIYLYQ